MTNQIHSSRAGNFSFTPTCQSVLHNNNRGRSRLALETGFKNSLHVHERFLQLSFVSLCSFEKSLTLRWNRIKVKTVQLFFVSVFWFCKHPGSFQILVWTGSLATAPGPEGERKQGSKRQVHQGVISGKQVVLSEGNQGRNTPWKKTNASSGPFLRMVRKGKQNHPYFSNFNAAERLQTHWRFGYSPLLLVVSELRSPAARPPA